MSAEADRQLVTVPPGRFARWVENFGVRHGRARLLVVEGALVGEAEDGSRFRSRLPFDMTYDGPPDVAAFLEVAGPPADWGVLLVRKGGFAVARLRHDRIEGSKVGQRHVQGRTKAGGQSQQRFARRRENQARAAYEAAADHAARLLSGLDGPLLTGGDRSAVAEVLADPRLSPHRVVGPWLDVPDPRRTTLESAVETAMSLRVVVENR